MKASAPIGIGKALAIAFTALLVAVIGLGLLATYVFGWHKGSGKNTAIIVVKDTNTVSRATVERLLKECAQTELPARATEAYGAEVSLFTRVINLRFTCPADDFRRMWITSPRLNFPLATNSVMPTGPSNVVWWQPASLGGLELGSGTWTSGQDTVTCDLMTGRAKDQADVSVYLQFVLERTPK